MEQAVSRILVSDKPSDNVGFKNPTYVFGFIRGQSPRYVCCVQTERDFKFQTTFRGCIRIPASDKYPDNVGFKNPTYVYLNGFNNFSDDLPFEKVV